MGRCREGVGVGENRHGYKYSWKYMHVTYNTSSSLCRSLYRGSLQEPIYFFARAILRGAKLGPIYGVRPQPGGYEARFSGLKCGPGLSWPSSPLQDWAAGLDGIGLVWGGRLGRILKCFWALVGPFQHKVCANIDFLTFGGLAKQCISRWLAGI